MRFMMLMIPLGYETAAPTVDLDPERVRAMMQYNQALKDAGVPTEMHLYADGGHAFGLRRTKDPITEWPQLVEKWLRTIGMISE